MKNNSQDIRDKFSDKLKKALSLSHKIAKERKAENIEFQDILQALFYQEGSIAAEILKKSGLKDSVFTTKKEKENTTQNLGKMFKFINEKDEKPYIQLSTHLKSVLIKAVHLSRSHNHSFVGTEHFLLALINSENPEVALFLKKNKADTSYIKNQLENILESTAKFSDMTTMFTSEKKSKKRSNSLAKYTENLTKKEFTKAISPVIEREKEIERILHILGRKKKNNVLLVGDPGVGKTAIAEGLAKKITEKDIPQKLMSKKILRLDLAKIIAGTMFRGEFEGRLKNIIDAASRNDNIIIFIDEIHTVMGLGNAQGSMDANNILKPALTSGKFQCIGTTTYEEYRKHIENDAAFERRFHVVKIDEPTEDQAIKIIDGIKSEYESFHNVHITDSAIEKAVKLSHRYIPEKNLPDKAIDILDEASSKLNLKKSNDKIFAEIEGIQKQIDSLENEKHEKALKEDFRNALKLQAKEETLKKKLQKLYEKSKKDRKDWPKISEKHIEEIISSITNIPLNKIQVSEKEKLINLEKILKQKIIGQDQAIETISKFTRRARSGLTHPKRPTGSFMFLGPTGTGKTELAKVIAEEIFGDEKALIRIDMSEFGEKFNSSKLIGAPAGYVGYDEGGKLTEEVRKRPYSVVLFDEIEKAHPDIFNLLLQILDEGFITDAKGRKVNFRNTFIIMTSNTGSRSLSEQELGFRDESNSEAREKEEYQRQSSAIKAALKETYSPEFLNRIDRIIIFKPLGKKAIDQIVDIKLDEFAKRIKKQKNISITLTPNIKELIAQKGFDPERGARPLRKAIEEIIEDELAEKIIEDAVIEGDKVEIKKTKNGIVFTKK